MIIKTIVGKETIYFDDEKHRFWRMENGKKIAISSVTTFTGVIDKSQALIGWAIKLAREFLLTKLEQGIDQETVIEACRQHTIKKKEAGDIGTAIHDLCEKWIKQLEFDIPDDEKVRNGFDAFLKFQQEHKVKWLESEKIVFSNIFDFAGITDAIGEIEGELVLVDFKSANAIYPEHVLQAAAYQLAYEEMTGETIKYRLIIRFGKDDGEFEVQKYAENDKDIIAFTSCLNLKRRLRELDKKKYENESKE